MAVVRTKKSRSPDPLRTMGLYGSTMAKINRFVREGIKQQERALPEDGDKEEMCNIIEYVRKCLSTYPRKPMIHRKIHCSLSSLNVLLITLFFFDISV